MVCMYDHHKCLETFSNKLRMRLLRLLEAGAKNVTELTGATGAERSRVSHALLELKKCNVVDSEKQGREMRYSLRKHTPVSGLKGTMFQIIDTHVKHNCAACHKLHGKEL